MQLHRESVCVYVCVCVCVCVCVLVLHVYIFCPRISRVARRYCDDVSCWGSCCHCNQMLTFSSDLYLVICKKQYYYINMSPLKLCTYM